MGGNGTMTKQIIIKDCLDCPHSEFRGTQVNTFYSIFCLDHGIEIERYSTKEEITAQIPSWCNLEDVKQ